MTMENASMMYEASETKKYKQPSVGTHTGICYLIADIGTQKTSYEGEDKEVHQIIFGWQLPEETTDEGVPLSVIKTYTLSFNEKATLAKDYKAWTKESNPTKFNLAQLIGKGCNLNVGVTSGGNAKVTGVSALKASETIPGLTVPTALFDLRNPDAAEIAKLPNFIIDKINASPEYKAYLEKPKAGNTNDLELNDSVPF